MTVPLRRIIIAAISVHFFALAILFGLTPLPLLSSCFPGVRKQSCVMRRCVRMTSNSSSGGGGGGGGSGGSAYATSSSGSFYRCRMPGSTESDMYEVGARELPRRPPQGSGTEGDAVMLLLSLGGGADRVEGRRREWREALVIRLWADGAPFVRG